MYRILILAFFFSACASSEKEYISNAHPAAYSADSFLVNPPAPKRERDTKSQFYFKDCTPTEGKNYYSNTSYFCDDISY